MWPRRLAFGDDAPAFVSGAVAQDGAHDHRLLGRITGGERLVLLEIDALREQWFEAPDEAAQRELARQIQLLVWRDVPFIPLGTYYQTTAFHRSLSGISRAGVDFVNVKRS